MDIPGLYYIENYLSSEEQTKILKNIYESIKLINIGSKSSRRVAHFGYEYSYNGSGIKKIDAIPDFYTNLIDNAKINKIIKTKILKDKMEQLIINEYLPGQGISQHIDHVKFFGPIIICLTIGSGCEIEFINKFTKTKKSLYVAPGSLYIMTGDSRYNWTHSIPFKNQDNGIARKIRYSLTFRTIIKKTTEY
ncbi:Alpha-ketoglutarate-dependent repair dioxygenase AlkB [uncultured virus]|nr:Alpha-ketoglutarate-dependent repair dioxygenase AlkB [uncultured virus]